MFLVIYADGTQSMKNSRKYLSNLLLALAWFTLVGVGFWKLFVYSNNPGEDARVSADWPKNTHLSRDHGVSTLIIFAHPHCPCSAATIGELERLIPQIRDKANSVIVFFKPAKKSDDWVKNETLWKRALSIPGVHLEIDDGGIEASLFDAKTSGQTFLYDSEGKLVFRGGITPARGHMGDSVGRSSILQYFKSGTTQITEAPVFGCSLKNPKRAVAGERIRNEF